VVPVPGDAVLAARGKGRLFRHGGGRKPSQSATGLPRVGGGYGHFGHLAFSQEEPQEGVDFGAVLLPLVLVALVEGAQRGLIERLDGAEEGDDVGFVGEVEIREEILGM
jgi:hypothetical protein